MRHRGMADSWPAAYVAPDQREFHATLT